MFNKGLKKTLLDESRKRRNFFRQGVPQQELNLFSQKYALLYVKHGQIDIYLLLLIFLENGHTFQHNRCSLQQGS